MFASLIPTIFYWIYRKTVLESLVKNSWYKWTWQTMWIGHLTLYAFPGLFWPVSFAGNRGFNSVYVMWQQYATYLIGTLLSVTVWILFAISYFTYTVEAA